MQIYLLQELFGGGKCGNGGGLRLGASGGIDTDSDINQMNHLIWLILSINTPKKGLRV